MEHKFADEEPLPSSIDLVGTVSAVTLQLLRSGTSYANQSGLRAAAGYTRDDSCSAKNGSRCNDASTTPEDAETLKQLEELLKPL